MCCSLDPNLDKVLFEHPEKYVLFFKGISVVYYGEEIGMVDADISYEDTMDPWGCNCGPINYVNCSRDPARTPMQWSENKNAGFSQVRPHKP